MAEYLTKYPKTISFLDGLKKVVSVDSSSSVEQLHIVVKKMLRNLSIYSSRKDLPVLNLSTNNQTR